MNPFTFDAPIAIRPVVWPKRVAAIVGAGIVTHIIARGHADKGIGKGTGIDAHLPELIPFARK